MNLTQATYVQLAPQFGCRISRRDDPVATAADWLWRTHLGQLKHTEVLVRSCKAPVPEPTGVARVDRLLAENGETGFMSGNTSSNVQSSQIIPPYNQRQVNGFTVIDGVELHGGMLQERAFHLLQKTDWILHEHRSVFMQVEPLLGYHAKPPGVLNDESCTFVHVFHMRDKATRYDYPSPVVTHGFLLVGPTGQLHFHRQVNPSELSSKMMARAKMALTYERYDEQDLLRIEGGRFTHVHEDVLALLQGQGHDTSQINIQPDELETTDSPSVPTQG